MVFVLVRIFRHVWVLVILKLPRNDISISIILVYTLTSTSIDMIMSENISRNGSIATGIGLNLQTCIGIHFCVSKNLQPCMDISIGMN